MPAMWFEAAFKNSWIGAVTLAALLGVMVAGYAAGWQRWHRGYWAPFAVVGLAIIFGVNFT